MSSLNSAAALYLPSRTVLLAVLGGLLEAAASPGLVRGNLCFGGPVDDDR